MNSKALGRRINIARKDKGLTSEKLSEMCNINATYLRQIEAGSRIPSLPMFVLICRKLQVTPSYLLSGVMADCETDGMEDIVELWQKASPSQLRLISAMTKSALAVITEE